MLLLDSPPLPAQPLLLCSLPCFLHLLCFLPCRGRCQGQSQEPLLGGGARVRLALGSESTVKRAGGSGATLETPFLPIHGASLSQSCCRALLLPSALPSRFPALLAGGSSAALLGSGCGLALEGGWLAICRPLNSCPGNTGINQSLPAPAAPFFSVCASQMLMLLCKHRLCLEWLVALSQQQPLLPPRSSSDLLPPLALRKAVRDKAVCGH